MFHTLFKIMFTNSLNVNCMVEQEGKVVWFQNNNKPDFNFDLNVFYFITTESRDNICQPSEK